MYSDRSNEMVKHVQERRQKLKELLAELSTPDEQHAMDEFNRHWEELLKRHKELMELALQNSNFKANALLEGKCLDNVTTIRDAVLTLLQQIDKELARPETEKNSSRILLLDKRGRLLWAALSSVQEMYRLLDAHNGPDDQQKPVLEAQRRSLDKELDGLLRNVESGLDEKERGSFDRPAFERLRLALSDFRQTAREVERLSRSNSFPRAVRLSLGEASTALAECDGSLHQLNAAVRKEVRVRPEGQ